LTAPPPAVRCPAKINLALHVLGRRPDGYHELDTVFQTIDLWDRLEVRPAEDLSLECNDPALPTDGSNLVLRAAELLLERRVRRRRGAALRLHKSIPAQGGLGGGSSDAAGALRLLAEHWTLDVDDETLAALGAELGADVPFFLVGGTARGLARGDRIQPLAPLSETPLVLGMPPFGISTAEVFRRLSERLTLPENLVTVRGPCPHKWLEEKDFGDSGEAGKAGSQRRWASPEARNDLEPVVFEGWPELKRFRDALLRAGALGAMVSGSGSAVYGLFREPAETAGASVGLQRQFGRWRVLTSRTVRGGVRLTPPRQGG